MGVVLRKATKLKTWKSGLKLKKKKKKCDQTISDGEVVGPKSLHIQELVIYGTSTGQIIFSFWSFNFLPRLDFYQKTLKKCKNQSYFSFE